MPTTAIQEKIYTTELMFDNLIGKISEHKAMILDRKAPSDLVNFYNLIRVGTEDELNSHLANRVQQDFLSRIIPTFISEIADLSYNKIAFDYSNNEILVWVELKDDDWASESAFILAAAKVNAEYYKFGYDITITFVEESDKLDIPNHYHQI